MKVNFDMTHNRNYNQSFKMNFVKDASLSKYINSLHIKKQQNNLKDALELITNNIARIPDRDTLIVGALHPSKANLVKSGTYDEFFTNSKGKTIKKTSNILNRENIFLKREGDERIQGFYLNPDENPKTLANWFMDTFSYFKNSFPEKS